MDTEPEQNEAGEPPVEEFETVAAEVKYEAAPDTAAKLNQQTVQIFWMSAEYQGSNMIDNGSDQHSTNPRKSTNCPTWKAATKSS